MHGIATSLKSIKARLLVALLLTLTVTLAMAGVLYFGARSLEKNARLTGDANEEVRDLLGFATAAHRYMNGFGQSLGQRTVIANNERRLAAEAFEARIRTIGTEQGRGLVSALPWDDLRQISSDLSQKLKAADKLRAQGKFQEAEHLFNQARKTDFDQRMLPWFDAAITSQRNQVEQLEAEAVHQAATLRISGNVLGGISAVLITLVVLATLLAIVRPVRLLVQGARAIADGDLSHRIPYTGDHELGVLASRFNEMAAVVEKSRSTLLEKNAALEEAYQLQSDFLSIVSHELRSPLNSIIGYTELVLEDGHELSPQGAKNVATIATGARRLLTLINDILDFSKLRAGRMQTREEPVRLLELCELVVADARALTQGRALQIMLETSGEDDLVSSDETKLRQILTNLLSNAVKFTDRGEVRLTLDLAAPHEVVLSVSDTGIGVPQEQLAIIFEPFRQAKGSDRRAVGGTGLGLAIVSRLTRLLGGDVSVQSETGRGTTFTVRVPRMPLSPQSGEVSVAQGSRESEPSAMTA